MAIAVQVLADPNDWVNINYIVHQTSFSNSRSSTTDAQASIIHNAGTTAQCGPWTVSKGIVAPSGDPHDYLSWAPYHWPNCNWCGGQRTNLAHSTNATDDGSNDSDNDSGRQDGGSDDLLNSAGEYFNRDRSSEGEGEDDDDTSVKPSSWLIETLDATPLPNLPQAAVSIGQPSPLPPLAPTGVSLQSPASGVSQTSDRPANGTPAPAQAPAKTQKGKSSCTPSPTKSMAPSATWTTCPYALRDGQRNPDVRTLSGLDAINSISQSVLYNAISYVLQKSSTNSRNVASFIDTFFLDPSTKMNPNMNYGQVVRGPGRSGQLGTFTGILDLRGTVKLVNAIMLMKSSGCPDWTSARDRGMNSWMSQYLAWLEDSDIGKTTASRPNNHASFYISQLTALKMFNGDTDGAAAALANYFSHQFLDQIAASGEQPFEAIRTRPFHYRCFNLEAMITNAKLGDQLGLNFWTAKSKYGATIQKALDFAMALNPKNEDITEIVPHVAAIAAAYGDPQGKYSAFLAQTMANYQAKPLWFYNQTPALPSSPAATAHERRTTWVRDDAEFPFKLFAVESEEKLLDSDFQCPAVFGAAVDSEVELDNGVFVSCDDLRPFYHMVVALG